MTGKARICPRGALSWRGGGGRGGRRGKGGLLSERHGTTLGGVKFFEMSFSHF